MKPRQPRVPVRWGFVLMSGLVVALVGAVAFHFASKAVSAHPEYRTSAVTLVKRALAP